MNHTLTTRTLLILFSALLLAAPAMAASPADAEEWRAKTDIEVDINYPPENTYVGINHFKSMRATAEDIDECRIGDTWYDYSDDVTSGSTESDYHIWWTATEGSFTDQYGTW